MDDRRTKNLAWSLLLLMLRSVLEQRPRCSGSLDGEPFPNPELYNRVRVDSDGEREAKPQVDTTSDTYTHLAPQAAKAPVPSQPDESVTSNFTIEQSTIKNHECCKRN